MTVDKLGSLSELLFPRLLKGTMNSSYLKVIGRANCGNDEKHAASLQAFTVKGVEKGLEICRTRWKQ